MLPSFDKLTKMLTQEKRLGYENKAVFGGFEKLAPNWANEARAEVETDDLRQVVDEITQSLSHYPQVSAQERPNYIHQILVKLHKAGESTSGDEQPQKQPTPEAKVNSAPQTAPEPPKHKDDTAGAKPEPETIPVSNFSDNKAKAVSEYKPAPPADLVHTGLDSPVTKLPGIKTAMAAKLARLGVETIGDFLQLYPRRYDDYRSLKPINQLEYGEEVTIIGQVWETRKWETRNKMPIITSILTDGTATIEASWFNQPWLQNQLRPGKQIVISGKVDQYLGRLTFQSPEWEELDADLSHTGRIVPVYPLTKGITSKWLRNQVKSTVNYWTQRLPDYLPNEARDRLKMPPLETAVRQIHFPDDWDSLEQARRRLAFDELLLIQLGVLRQRQAWKSQQGQPIAVQPEGIERLKNTLPFQLTGAQQKALTDIVRDMQNDVPMSRLIQGDVGSGKTAVALISMALAVQGGGQAAILAPTEILSEQHFKSMSTLLAPMAEALERQISIRLLTGSTPAAERREILDGLRDGHIDILVGTHAIIQSDVEFKNLTLAVIDEQHRFGVEQRGLLREKGFNPHMLVMTATPIPRTLALTLYGDLDLSIIDEMPPGRQPIQTRWLTPQERERAYTFIQAQVEKGRQAFIICPLVEESEKTEAKSAIEEHERLQKQIFPHLKLGLLHGRMKSDEKDEMMKAFRDQQMQILVSTSVVEVGIDVPNAAVMLVEGANRFGLSQLHQFRGRVGRGEHQSYCLLLADKVTVEAEERLKTVEQTLDGFKLAEKDLEMRGPGEFFGTRQSGLPDLKLVKLSDTRLLELARQEAQFIFEKDSTLELPQHRLLVKQIDNFWKQESDLS